MIYFRNSKKGIVCHSVNLVNPVGLTKVKEE